MKFTLEIKIGNEAMQNGDDVANALRVVAGRVEGGGEFVPGEGNGILDLNGDWVGDWRVGGDSNE
jgi:hypothetical protein